MKYGVLTVYVSGIRVKPGCCGPPNDLCVAVHHPCDQGVHGWVCRHGMAMQTGVGGAVGLR